MTNRRRIMLMIAFFSTAAGMLFVTSCQANGETTEPTTDNPTETIVGASDTSIQAEYWQAWGSSAHADTYAPEKGPNTYCSRCHSPLNWDRSATIDDPPQCVSCKFPHEEEPRVAAGNPHVSEGDWKDIGCEICHRMDGNLAVPEPAWLDVETNFYETVATSSELCGECHLDNETLRHARHLGDEAHSQFACTECHDAHTLEATCNSGGCHADVKIPRPDVIPEHRDQMDNSECTECHRNVADIHMGVLDEAPEECIECHGLLMGGVIGRAIELGHGETHESVACVACHDAGGLEAGPEEGSDEWVVYRTIKLLGRDSTNIYQSHNLQRDVACDRCHYADNPWGISAVVHELLN